MQKKEIRLVYTVDNDDEVQDFLGKLYDRQAEQALLKAWKKVFGGETEEELKARNVVIQDPAIFFETSDGGCRIATPGFDGRDTGEDLVEEVKEKFEKAGLLVSNDGVVRDPAIGDEVAGPI